MSVCERNDCWLRFSPGGVIGDVDLVDSWREVGGPYPCVDVSSWWEVTCVGFGVGAWTEEPSWDCEVMLSTCCGWIWEACEVTSTGFPDAVFSEGATSKKIKLLSFCGITLVNWFMVTIFTNWKRKMLIYENFRLMVLLQFHFASGFILLKNRRIAISDKVDTTRLKCICLVNLEC